LQDDHSVLDVFGETEAIKDINLVIVNMV